MGRSLPAAALGPRCAMTRRLLQSFVQRPVDERHKDSRRQPPDQNRHGNPESGGAGRVRPPLTIGSTSTAPIAQRPNPYAIPNSHPPWTCSRPPEHPGVIRTGNGHDRTADCQGQHRESPRIWASTFNDPNPIRIGIAGMVARMPEIAPEVSGRWLGPDRIPARRGRSPSGHHLLERRALAIFRLVAIQVDQLLVG